MCGIFGWFAFDNKKMVGGNKIFSKLMDLSIRRGKDASGVWLGNGIEDCSLIFPVDGDKLIRSKEFFGKISPKIDEARVVLGHCRLATNGKREDEKNNQPMNGNGLVLAHNGIIVNSKELAEKFGVEAEESDSLVLFKILEKLKNENVEIKKRIKAVAEEINGTVNLAIVERDKKNFNLILASNNGSLYFVKNKNRIYFASEKYFLKELCKLIGQKLAIRQVLPNEGWEFNGKNRAGKRFVWKKQTVKKQGRVLGKELPWWAENHKIDFEKLKGIKRCTKCILPANTPFIKFDEKGVCNYCNDHKKIKYKGETALKKLTEKYRSKTGKPDCILAFSGGRDSAYGLHYLIKVLKMHPIAVTFDWGMLSDVGRRNQARMLSALGVEHIVVAADIKKAREDIKMNLEAWLSRPDLGMVPILMQGDKTTEHYVDRIKKELGVKLVFFCRGNELENEEFKAGYCGVKNADPGGVIHNYFWLDKIKLLLYYVKRFLLNPKYLNRSLMSSFWGYLITYVVPHDYVYLWHYVPWNEEKIVGLLKEKYGWESDEEVGITWRVDDGSPAFYNYLYCQMQGFTENDSFRSHQIREGMMCREEALKTVFRENQPRYKALNWYFESIGMDGDKVLEIIDKAKKKY